MTPRMRYIAVWTFPDRSPVRAGRAPTCREAIPLLGGHPGEVWSTDTDTCAHKQGQQHFSGGVDLD